MSSDISIGKQVFGAEVVSKTLDYLNKSDSSGGFGAVTDKQTFVAAVVSGTLNAMNSGSLGGGGNSSDYGFQKDVLAAGALGKGGMVNGKV